MLHKAYTLRNTLNDRYHKPMSLVWVIIQDQILFFAWLVISHQVVKLNTYHKTLTTLSYRILSCFLLHFVELKTENEPIVQIAGVLLRAPPLPCVIGCYTMLHLKESGKQDSFLSFSSIELEGELSQICFSWFIRGIRNSSICVYICYSGLWMYSIEAIFCSRLSHRDSVQRRR